MRAALISMLVTAVLLGGGPPASEAQPRPRPRGPGATGGVPRPDPTGQPRRPVRDPRQPPAEGTATVRGRVVDGTTGQAIPRAKVRVGNRDPRNSRVATTDTEGAFTLTRIPSGPLILTVEKVSYLSGTYPERRRTMRSSSLEVGEGQTVDNITIPLFRGGAITGRVIDAYGDPVEHAMVHVFAAPQTGRSGTRGGGARASQSTNDIGEYRIGRMEPGQYYVMVAPQRRGDYQDDTSSAPGRTWYPGVASFDQAQPITLERGASAAGIDFQMLETTLTRVSGHVLTSKGTAAKNGHISVRAAGASKGMPQGLASGWGEVSGTGVDMYGNFDLTLQPGEYVFEAQVQQGDETARQAGRMEMDRGQVRLVVGGEAMSGVTIATGSGGTASGRFVFKGTSAPPASFGGFSVAFTGPSGGFMGNEDCRAFNNRTTVNPDGTFSGENIWGTCQIRGGGMAKGWTFEAVMHNGNDITHRVIEFGAGQSISGVEIIYTDRIGEVTVTVSDDRGTATDDYVAVVFPVDKEKWIDQRFMRAQTMTAKVNASQTGAPGATAARVSASTFDASQGTVTTEMFSGGTSTIRNLLAGDYFAVAVEDTSYEDLRDPEFLERLAQMATRVSISSGQTQTVQLRRVKAPE